MKFHCRILFFLILIGLFFSLFAQNINQKKNELNQIKKQIQTNKKKAEEVEKKKKEALKNKSHIEKKLAESSKIVNQLKSNEKVLKKNIDLKKDMLDQTNTEINHFSVFTNQVIKELVLIETQEKYSDYFSSDKYPLAILINQSNRKINSLSIQKAVIENEKNNTENEMKSLHFQTMIESKKAKTFSLQSSQFKKDIDKYEREKQTYINQAKKLQKTAASLENLIKKLTPKPEEKKKFTYKFPGSGIMWPAKGKVIRNFGIQTHEKYNIQTVNNGIDIALKYGSSVNAAADGEVVFSGAFSGSGQMIIIDHKNGFHSVYANNSQLTVNKGDRVKKGQLVAYSGNSSSTDEASLHFELRKNGKPVNPLSFLK